MFGRFLLRFYPICIAGAGLFFLLELWLGHIELRELLLSAVMFLIVGPVVIYPLWAKQQLASPAERAASVERRNVNSISLGLCLCVSIPTVLLICMATKNAAVQAIGIMAGGFAFFPIYYLVRTKLKRHHNTDA